MKDCSDNNIITGPVTCRPMLRAMQSQALCECSKEASAPSPQVASKCESVLSAVRKHRSEEPNCSPLPKYVEDYLEYPVRLLKKSKH
eukprot:jgi/Botrbrau1/12041/Bobra.0293s0017.1